MMLLRELRRLSTDINQSMLVFLQPLLQATYSNILAYTGFHYRLTNQCVLAEYPDPSFGNSEQKIRDAVARINRELPQNRNIADLIMRSEPFPKTTTLKIKRDGRK